MKNLLIILLAICMVLFVLVPLSYIVLGKIDNPLAIGPASIGNLAPTYKGSGVVDDIEIGSKTKDIEKTCNNSTTAYTTHVRDVVLLRDDDPDEGDDTSEIKSSAYSFSMKLKGVITDWQYSVDAVGIAPTDEVASFIYKDTIINILARKSIDICKNSADTIYKNFHDNENAPVGGTYAVEYFSSRTYLDQVKSLGIASAVFRAHGESSIKKHDYHWYMLDELYTSYPDRPIVTIWYSTKVSNIEYWFAFRTYQSLAGDLNEVAEEVIKSIVFN